MTGGPCQCIVMRVESQAACLVTAAGRLWFAASWFWLAATAMTAVTQLVLPGMQTGQQAEPRTAARIRLTASRLWCTAGGFGFANWSSFAASWLRCTAGRLGAATAMTTMAAKQVERLSARRAGQQHQASGQDQNLTLHGD